MKKKGFGAAIASSISEIHHFNSEKPQFRNYNPFRELPTDKEIQEIQSKYLVADSFKIALQVSLKFAETLKRPFSAWYNQKDQKIEVDKMIIT